MNNFMKKGLTTTVATLITIGVMAFGLSRDTAKEIVYNFKNNHPNKATERTAKGTHTLNQQAAKFRERVSEIFATKSTTLEGGDGTPQDHLDFEKLVVQKGLVNNSFVRTEAQRNPDDKIFGMKFCFENGEFIVVSATDPRLQEPQVSSTQTPEDSLNQARETVSDNKFNTQDMNIELILDEGLTIGDISASNQTEMAQKLNIPDALARYYASFINKAMSRQGTYNHAFYQNFVNAVNVVNYFVYQGDIDSRQGWLVIFRIIDADILKKYPNLFQESETALAQNADLKGFYHKGNKHVWQSQGAQGMIESDNIIQYADMSNYVPTTNSGSSNNSSNSGNSSNSNNSTNSGNSSNTGTTPDLDAPLAGLDLDGLVEKEKAKTAKLQQELQNLMQKENASKDAVLKAARNYVNAGGNPADLPGWDDFAKRYNISPDDL